MKTLKSKLNKTVLFLLLAIAFIGCSKDDKPTDPETNTEYFLTAKVDGVDFSRDNVFGSTDPEDMEFFLITAVGETSIGLALNSPPSTGTFTTAIDENVAMTYQTSDISDGWWIASEDYGSGTIITKNNATYIEGTFSFSAFNGLENTTKQITEGKFKAKKI